jgi:hypothetical protein
VFNRTRGRPHQPPGELAHEVPQLVGTLDDERPVEHRQDARHPVEFLGAQFNPLPTVRQLVDRRHARGQAQADLLGRRLDAQRDLVSVRGPGQAREDAFGRVVRRGRPERTRQRPGRGSAIRSTRKVRSSARPTSSPLTYQRPACATRPYGCIVRSVRRPSPAM